MGNNEQVPVGSSEFTIGEGDGSGGIIASNKNDEAQKGNASKPYIQKLSERIDGWFADEDKVKWMEDMRGNLSTAASIIATMSFQLATNPPGGVLQASPGDVQNPNTVGCIPVFPNPKDNSSAAYSLCPGNAVLGVVTPGHYQLFLAFNSLSFTASLSVCLIMVSGIRLKHRLPMWLLSIAMFVTITSLALSYLFATSMVTPNNIWGKVDYSLSICLLAWIFLLSLIGLVMFVRFLVWFSNKYIYAKGDNIFKHMWRRLYDWWTRVAV